MDAKIKNVKSWHEMRDLVKEGIIPFLMLRSDDSTRILTHCLSRKPEEQAIRLMAWKCANECNNIPNVLTFALDTLEKTLVDLMDARSWAAWAGVVNFRQTSPKEWLKNHKCLWRAKWKRNMFACDLMDSLVQIEANTPHSTSEVVAIRETYRTLHKIIHGGKREKKAKAAADSRS